MTFMVDDLYDVVNDDGADVLPSDT